MPLDWNKINEEDSSISGYDSTLQDQFQIPIPKMAKINSDSCVSIKKLKTKSSLSDLSELNIQKLLVLETQQVWLFIPKASKSDNSQDIYQILKELKNIKKIIPNTGGWNILVSKKQQAKKLIEGGYKKNKISLRFYVSTKNYDQNITPQMRRKGSASSSNFNDRKMFNSPQQQRKDKFEQKINKKKVKYLEKKTETIQQNQNIILEEQKASIEELNFQEQIQYREHFLEVTDKKQFIQIPFIQQIIKKEQQENSNLEAIYYNSPQSQYNISQHQVPKLQSNQKNNESQTQQILTPEQSLQKNQELEVKKQELNDQLQQQEYDSQESLQRMKMALKKKNKKLNKKKGCGSPQSYSDENNPFCLLGKLK